ncbi:uncharacterized protein LOC141614648 [Silene latifolia]|uniref:uncharacterized protein LOC141614648 n=1 Tax=Silene latifolia TaxID=37657 RepID=UPI003D772310
MATIMVPTRVKAMEAYKKTYEVTVRVLRKWIRDSDEQDVTKRTVYGMEFICIDSEGELIQVTVANTLVRIFKPMMHEGKIYTISKFLTENNIGKDRATFHKCRIVMQFTTRVKEVDGHEIPSQAFTFVSIEDIIHGNVENEYYIDVIGVLTQFHEFEEIKGYKKLCIDLMDEQKRRIKLTVWERYFPEIAKLQEQCKYLDEKPILVLKCVQRKEWFGNVSLSTTRGATKFELNPNIPQVEEFKNRIKAISNDAISGPIGKASKESNIFAGKVTQEADQLWYCKKPGCKVENIGVPKAYPRFQLKVEASDGDQVRAQLMLWDSPISKIVGKQASTILEAQEREGDKEAVPLEFREIMDREFIAKILVDQEYNIRQKSICYKATQLCGDKDVIAKWKELEECGKATESSGKNSAITISGSEISNTELMLLENVKTYDEEEIENTPISKLPQKRAWLEDDGFEITEVREMSADQGSSSKATIPIKNIKIEK